MPRETGCEYCTMTRSHAMPNARGTAATHGRARPHLLIDPSAAYHLLYHDMSSACSKAAVANRPLPPAGTTGAPPGTAGATRAAIEKAGSDAGPVTLRNGAAPRGRLAAPITWTGAGVL